MMVAILAIVFADEAAWCSSVGLGLSAARPGALYLRLRSPLDHAIGGVARRTRPRANSRSVSVHVSQ